MAIYARSGVTHVWLVDPLERGLEAYRLDTDRGLYLLLGLWGAEEVARIEPFDAIELALGELWPPEEPGEPEMASDGEAEYRVSGG
jgi:Uma2 family endonuclease